jgi:Ca2+-dependent lipid-binding protein
MPRERVFEKGKGMARIKIDVAQLEFEEGGNTIWIHSPIGATVLRIKTMGKLTTKKGCKNVCSHADIVVNEDIEICLADDAS